MIDLSQTFWSSDLAIPDLNDDGVLPEGLHECSLDEVIERFGQFSQSDRRRRLGQRLQEFLREVGSTRLAVAVIVDGSFVTGKREPNDIDLVLVLRAGHNFSEALRPFEYNVVSRRRVRKTFGFDMLLADEGQPELREYIAFFSQVRGNPDVRKGLLRVTL